MPYLTLAQRATAEIVEKKSRFIAYGGPVGSEAEARGFLEEIRSQHRDATHHVYAYQIGAHNEIQRSNDDGEPAGTAGRPVLEVIKNANLKDSIIVVVRYFGGTLLGTGGLTRAYGRSAMTVLPACGIVEQIPAAQWSLTFDYSLLGAVEAYLRQRQLLICEKVYQDVVLFVISVPCEEAERLPQELADLSGGSIRLTDLGEQTLLRRPWQD